MKIILEQVDLLRRVAEGEMDAKIWDKVFVFYNKSHQVSMNRNHRYTEDYQGASINTSEAFLEVIEGTFTLESYKKMMAWLRLDIPTLFVAARMERFNEDWATALEKVKKHPMRWEDHVGF